MAWSLFWNIFSGNYFKIIFLIKMAHLEIDGLNFGNS
jgi:hypothetical protein